MKWVSVCVSASVIFVVVAGATAVHAGTLSCTVRSGVCEGDEVTVWRMSGTSNAHAELASQANYAHRVCCTGVTGLGTECSGTYAEVLKLSGTSNAHAEQNSQSLYGEQACLSVPNGGTVTVGYQSTDCSGYDTTLGSMSGVTNAHVGDGTAYTTKICATATGVSGTLTVDIVDAGGSSVSAPTMAMTDVPFSFIAQTATGTFGTAAERVRVENATGNAQWSLTLAALNGPTSVWTDAAGEYDYNDPTASGLDGADADNRGGQMTINAVPAILSGTCSDTSITKGAQASFSEGSVDSVTLLAAGSGANTGCYWEMVGVVVSQTIPREQPAGAGYGIEMMLTVTAM